MRLRQYDPLERELRRPHLLTRIDADGNARMSRAAGYLLCVATAALVLGAGWWALSRLG